MSSHNASKQRLKMKVQILHALEILLEKQEYSNIEINDICKEAHISKPTFYRYFKNKDNIFRWMTKVAFKTGVVEIGRRFTWYEGYLITLMVTYRHRVFYSKKQNKEVINSLLNLGWRYQYDALCETVIKYYGSELNDKLKFQLESVARTPCAMSQKWGEEGMRVPPELMADYLASCTPCELYDLLNGTRKRQSISHEKHYY